MNTITAERMMRYIQLESISGNETVLYHMLEKELKEIGFTVLPCIQKESDLSVPNLYAYLAGRGESRLFSAHMDTIWHDETIKPYINCGVVYSSGPRILGADDKSGIAAIMEAASRIAFSERLHAPIEILFTVGEETGFAGSRAADYSMIKSKWAYVFDSSASFGSVIVRSPQMRLHRLDIQGKSAHAAIHPEQGINALVIAANIICSTEWGRLRGMSTTNVGNFLAEGATNIVCEHASFEVEARSFEPNGAEMLSESVIEKAKRICSESGATLSVEELLRVPGYKVQNDAPILKPVTQALVCHGIKPEIATSFGGSDANIFNANGLTAVNISTGMLKSHSVDEHISIVNLETIANVIVTMMENTRYEYETK